MGSPSGAPVPTPLQADDAVREHLERILTSPTFQQVDRLKRFLKFIVLEAVAGRRHELKEYVIGVQVFDKEDTFDPRTDPIVRVQARRLRAKLVRYYREEGRADETVIADGKEVEAVRESTNGRGAEAVIDFVGEGGALEDSIAMLRDGGSHYVVGYGGMLSIPAIDIISAEISFVGNLVGSYNDLAELMTLEAEGKVKLHTSTYPLDAADDAIDDLDQGRLHGRGILIP